MSNCKSIGRSIRELQWAPTCPFEVLQVCSSSKNKKKHNNNCHVSAYDKRTANWSTYCAVSQNEEDASIVYHKKLSGLNMVWLALNRVELVVLTWLGLVCFGLGNVCTGGPFVYLCFPFRNYGWLCHHFGIVACHISHCGGLLQSLNDLWNEIIAHLVQRDVPLFSPLLACVKVAVVADKWLVYCIHFCATNWHY